MTIPQFHSTTSNDADKFRLRTSVSEEPDTEFRRFAELAGKLADVPKSEIDEQRRQKKA